MIEGHKAGGVWLAHLYPLNEVRSGRQKCLIQKISDFFRWIGELWRVSGAVFKLLSLQIAMHAHMHACLINDMLLDRLQYV
jgi:hypothetical protein